MPPPPWTGAIWAIWVDPYGPPRPSAEAPPGRGLPPMARSLTVHDLQVRDDALAALTEELREADRLHQHALEQTAVLEAEAEGRGQGLVFFFAVVG